MMKIIIYQSSRNLHAFAHSHTQNGRSPFFDEAANDTESIMDGTFSLLDHQLVGAAHHNAHSLTWIGTTGDLYRNTMTGLTHLILLPAYTFTLQHYLIPASCK